jgi:glutamine synthetase adenylyltransferase
LPEEAVRELLDGFTFLTLLRQRLRLRSAGTPTDLLPEDPAEQEVLARSLGLTDGAALMRRYQATTARVRELFGRHFLES